MTVQRQRAPGAGFLSLLLTGLVASLLANPAQAQAAILVLDPAEGDPPSAQGKLSGAGWCTPASKITVFGSGVSGSAQVGRNGDLTGSFSVQGKAGEVVTIGVEAICRAGTTTARAQFRFNTPRATDTPIPPTETYTPRPTDTPTFTPTTTPTATASITPGPTLPPIATVPPVSATGTIAILGCAPAAPEVRIVFLQLLPTGGPAGPPLVVPVVGTDDPNLFAFQAPYAPAGTLFSVDPEVDSPACPPGWDPPSDYWEAGDSMGIAITLPGKTGLLESNLGEEPPLEAGEAGAEVSAGAWVVFFERQNSPAGATQVFRWDTEVPNVNGGQLQISVLPFPAGPQASLESPAGLVVSEAIGCVNCQFAVDLSPLAPAPAPQTPLQALIEFLLDLLESGWKAVQKATFDLIQNLSGKPAPALAEAGPPQIAPQNPGLYLNAGQGAPLLIQEYYFRILPTLDGELAGAPSNTTRIHFYAPELEIPDGLLDCSKQPELCAPSSGPRPYLVEILSYHGFIPPVEGKYGCYRVTEETTVQVGGSPVTYPKGWVKCPPQPKATSPLEAIIEFVVDSVNWVSQAYASLKSTVVDFVGQFVPSELCGKTCLSMILDAGLAAVGIPPNVPNFDQLMDQGVEYLASQAVEQVGVPEAVTQLGPLAEEQWKDELQQQFQQAIEQGVHAAQVATSNSVSWLPDGVPFEPDPESNLQPPLLLIRVIRDPAVPAEADTCSASSDPGKANLAVLSNVTQPGLTSQMEGFNNSHPGPDLQPAQWTYLYEAKSIPLPNLLPGETVTIPILLRPQFTWGAGSGIISLSDQATAWSAMYSGGQAQISVSNPCTWGDLLENAADGSFQGP
jgi:hypothetical protein